MGEYSKEDRTIIIKQICERIANGDSLRKICSNKDLPDRGTILAWLIDDDGIAASIARAREEQADHFFEEIIEIADECGISCSEEVQKAKLKIHARQWTIGRQQPKKYGDKLTHSNDPLNPIGDKVTFNVTELVPNAPKAN